MKDLQQSNFKFRRRKREFFFSPRIINPVKIKKAVFFSADEHVRKASKSLKEYMPWISIEILSDPVAASNYKGDVATALLFDDMALNFIDAKKIRQNNKDAILILLSANEIIHKSPPSVAREQFPYTGKADLIFAINHSDFFPESIITSVVRCAEDRLNILKYSQERRFIFLIVDDEPRWFSQFLPVLYKIIGQRADVMVTRTYEEAMDFLFSTNDPQAITSDYKSHGHGDDVVCLITDIYFPKGENLESDAGRELVHVVNKYYSRIPIIIASKAKQAEDLRSFAFILPKGDPGSLETLSEYIHNFTGLGDFLIRGKSGKEYYRIKHIQELYDIIIKADKNTKKAEELRQFFESYAEKDYFSTWLYMHGFRELGDQLRPRRDVGQRLVTILKRHIRREILKMEQTPLKIGRRKIFNLNDLLKLLKKIKPEKIQFYSDNDIFSNWLDRKGYPDLAEEFRPVHGTAEVVVKSLATIIEKSIIKFQSSPH